ncbi:MAG TPA: DUF721 domain-containing protein [Spirochaetota bacterium]|nr:DUF721 domain-containing protein [Spirochaetota bacterium]
MKFRIGCERNNRILSFSDILPDVIDDLNLEDTFFIENIRDKWESYVGNTLSVHSTPDRLFRKILFVKVDHSAYANELSLHSGNILNKLKTDFGPQLINSVRFELVKKSRYRK